VNGEGANTPQRSRLRPHGVKCSLAARNELQQLHATPRRAVTEYGVVWPASEMILKSTFEIPDTKSARVTMPDF
jgi:hypothetical protein